MGKGKGGRHRRRERGRFLPDAGTRHVIEMARKSNKGNEVRNQFQRNIENAPAYHQARKDAEKSNERNCSIRLGQLPDVPNITILVRLIDLALVKVLLNDGYNVPETAKFVRKCQHFADKRWAVVQLASEKLANRILELNRLRVCTRWSWVSKPRMPIQGATPSTRQEPGSFDYPIWYVEFGYMDGKDFNVLWSSQRANVEDGRTVQVQMISKVLGFQLGVEKVMCGDAKKGTFETKRSRIRLEIPFQAIIATAAYQRSSKSDSVHAVYFPLRFAPFIFREISAGNRATIWTEGQGEIQEMRYVRTVDFTENDAFQRTRAVRIFLDASGSNSSFSQFTTKLSQARIGDSNPPKIPRVVRPRDESFFGRIYSKAMEMARAHRVPFAVRYEIACLHSIGALSESELNQDEFWKDLGRLSKVDALRVTDKLYSISNSEPDFRINAMEALTESIRIVTASDTYSDVDSIDEGTSTLASASILGAGSARSREIAASVSVIPLDTDYFIDPGVTRATQALLREAANLESADVNFVPIRRVMVTPTKFRPCRAEMDMLNRVLREFSEFRERFIRVSFADEDGGSISYFDSPDLYAKVRHWLRYGIEVAGEKFVFLAFSASQLRDHGCWFYNESPDSTGVDSTRKPPDANFIRKWFGDLSKIRVPSRYAARMGQAFSSTVGTLNLGDEAFEYAPDFQKGKYIFSDGIGVVSRKLGEKLKASLRIGSVRSPSAYQIRFGGAKGVVSVWNRTPRLNGVRYPMILRQSMKKFEAIHRKIEVVGYSKRLTFCLNRQIITLLEGLGVDSNVFVQMQKNYLAEVDRCMEADGSDASLRLLYRTGWGGGRNEQDHLIRNVAPMANAVTLFRAGLTCTNCEFLYEIMLAFRRKILSAVRNHARIPVHQAVCAIGILDETAVLKKNEIFLQFTHPETRNIEPVRGKVIVGRSPCLHPGDLQIVNAVSKPELKHLVDVVVFPQVGERPLPNKLSGGDLDGDIFCVIWDKRLTSADATKQAMVYDAEKEKELDRPVNIDDVCDFVIRYMQNDNLGRIATAHLVHSDKESDGIFSQKALKLAQLHSTAVDFAKTGVPAEIPREYIIHKEEHAFPNFLGKHKKLSYPSKKALGLMYEAVMKGKSERNLEPFKRYSEEVKKVDKVFEQCAIDDNDLDAEARALCESWNIQLRALMEHFGVETEAEVVSGQVIRFTSQNPLGNGKKQYMEQLTVLNRYMKDLKGAFRAQFFSNVGKDEDKSITLEAVRKICAWYNAAKQIAAEDRRNKRQPMLSFPFVVSDVLVQVVAHHLNDDSSSLEGETPPPLTEEDKLAHALKSLTLQGEKEEWARGGRKCGMVSICPEVTGKIKMKKLVAMLKDSKCPYDGCNKQFNCTQDLEQHLNSVQTHPVWVCCGRPFLTMQGFLLHLNKKEHKVF